jgi:hypothetical protein
VKKAFQRKRNQMDTEAVRNENQLTSGRNLGDKAENREGRNASCPVEGELLVGDVDRDRKGQGRNTVELSKAAHQAFGL